jgi:hypothetical protein
MDTRKFDKMLKLENALRVSGAARALAPTNWERERATKSYESDKVRFYALLDSLTIDELREYGEYRKAARA